MKKMILALLASVALICSTSKASAQTVNAFVGGGIQTNSLSVGVVVDEDERWELNFTYMALFNYSTTGASYRTLTQSGEPLGTSNIIVRGLHHSSFLDGFNFFFGGGVVWQSVYRYSRNDYAYGYDSYHYDSYYYDDYPRTPNTIGLNGTVGADVTFRKGFFVRGQIDVLLVAQMPEYYGAGLGTTAGSPIIPTICAGFKF